MTDRISNRSDGANGHIILNNANKINAVSLDMRAAMFPQCYASDDFKTGIRPFADKRKPAFTGR